MEISRRVDYGVQVMLDVAAAPTGVTMTIGAIAQRRQIPFTFLKRVVSELATAGLLRTRRGQRGGLNLARPASAVTLLQIIEALDGPIGLNRCVLNPEECPQTATCPVRDVWCDAQRELRQRLDSTRLNDLVARSRELERLASAGLVGATVQVAVGV